MENDKIITLTNLFQHLLSAKFCLDEKLNFYYRQSQLKACVRYFLTNCYFSPITLQKLQKHLKRSFCSRDIVISVFPSSPLFLSVSHFALELDPR